MMAISHSATFTPFSALIQSAPSHVMAVPNNMALWQYGSAQQGLNGRKHFFRCSLAE